MSVSTDLQPLTLPAEDDWTTWLDERAEQALSSARASVEALKADPPGTLDALSALQHWNESQTALANAASAASLLSEVHPDRELRDRADAIMQDVRRYDTELGLDVELFEVLSTLDTTGLDPHAQRLHERTLRDFRRAGVDRDESTRDRLRELDERAVRLSQEFGKNIREGRQSIHVRPDQLDGLPQDWVDAHPTGPDGLVEVSTDYPDLIPFRTFSRDAEARRRLTEAYLGVAWPDNDGVLQELFAVRREHADLLGYDSWPDYDTEIKMIGSGEAVAEFIQRITQLSGQSAQRDKKVLLDRLRQDDPGAGDIDSADLPYYEELVRKEQHAVDAQQVRQYFRFEAVRAGLLEVTGRLFGLTWTPVDKEQAGTWHDEVASYDVGFDGQRIGRIHLDLHPRDGKFKHAAQFDLVRGVNGVQLPEGVLVCNFNRGLMEHNEVVTLFHEFGHLIHHVVGGRQDWVRFSGVATEWDFVEAPSQMLEEWAWDPRELQTFAHNEAGESIPSELVEAMRVADDFGKGYGARTQMFYAAVSYDFHAHENEDLTARLAQLQSTYSVFPYLPGTHFHCAFGHLDGYGSAYYTYMWSLVIAKDMFSAFDPDDLFDPEVAGAYRDKVLAPGGRHDAAELVADFLGRPYTFDAYAQWLAR